MPAVNVCQWPAVLHSQKLAESECGLTSDPVMLCRHWRTKTVDTVVSYRTFVLMTLLVNTIKWQPSNHFANFRPFSNLQADLCALLFIICVECVKLIAVSGAKSEHSSCITVYQHSPCIQCVYHMMFDVVFIEFNAVTLMLSTQTLCIKIHKTVSINV